jgi:alpha-tubulin suppressor-like RCC1 family protein
VRTSNHRLFSCGNGSTYALGHKNRESCSQFKQIEYFNGNEEGVGGLGIKTIACGLTHSGCVLEDGAVYLWGMSGDMLTLKDQSEKILLKKPQRMVFKNVDT